MTELMKRYEAETGKKAIIPLSDTGKNVYRPSFTEWLAAQLTWRDMMEKPKEGRVLIIESGRVLAVTYGTDDGDEYFLDDDGWECYPQYWLPIPKE